MSKYRERSILKYRTELERDRIRVVALVPYAPDTTPSQRFRIEQWIPCLNERGIQVDLLPFADQELMYLLKRPGRAMEKGLASLQRFFGRLHDLPKVSRYDVVLIHRAACIAGPAIVERLVKMWRKPIVFDFDDAIFKLDTSEANRHFGWLKFPGKTSTLCRISDCVVVGNTYLAEYAQRYNRNVRIIPTSVDTALYTPVTKTSKNSRVVVGWTGSSTSQTLLEGFAPLLRQLVAKFDIELRILSDREPMLPGIPCVWRPWSAESEVDEISQFDIGIMPIPDDEWARGKCALKALQYMALGIPPICSAVGANCEVIRDRENGILARTSDDWFNGLELLIGDPHLRQRMGMASRRTIEQRYSAQHCSDLFADVITDVATGHETKRLRSKQRSAATQAETSTHQAKD